MDAKMEAPDNINQLKRMRFFASGLLLAMFVAFIVAHFYENTHWLIGYAKAFAEAALVGGIADWFAVTALFKHPAGIPIPHTALVPKNKDRIGESLGEFVSENFMRAHIIGPHIAAFDPGRKIAEWIQEDQNKNKLISIIITALKGAVKSFDDDAFRKIMNSALTEAIAKTDAPTVLARSMEAITAGNYHQPLIDKAIIAAKDLLQSNRNEIRHKFLENSSWWRPKWADNKIADKVIDGLQETLQEMSDPEHPWRDRFSLWIDIQSTKMLKDPETRDHINNLKNKLLENEDLKLQLDAATAEIRTFLLADLEKEDSHLKETLKAIISDLAEKFTENKRLQRLLSRKVQFVVSDIAEKNRDKIGKFISATVKAWDTKTLISNLENKVGKDLQFIRINGTLVGGLIGLIIHGILSIPH